MDGKPGREMVREGSPPRYEFVRAPAPVGRSEQELRRALAEAGLGCWEWDLRTDVALWDRRMRELLGVNEFTPATSESFLTLVDKPDRGRLRHVLARAVATAEGFQAEFRVYRPVARTFAWLSLHATMTADESGRGVRLLALARDITRNKQREEDLRRSNRGLEEQIAERTGELTTTVDQLHGQLVQRVLAEDALQEHARMLETFFLHSITPLAFLDRHFDFVRVNRAYAAAAGRRPEDFPGQNYFILQARPEDRAIFEQVVQTKQPYAAPARPFTDSLRPEHPVTYWDWRLTPLLDGDGQVQSLVLTLENVTEQREALLELAHRAQQLQGLVLEVTEAEDRERRRVAEILHDDLQQILAAAKFQLSVLDSGARSPERTREIVHQVKEMLREAIEKSRSLSHELSPAVLHQGDLKDMLDWLAGQMHSQHGLTVHVQTRGPLDVPSEMLKVFLYRTIQELLFNVVKHAQVREAHLRVGCVGRCLGVRVSDRGCGFDPGQRSPTAGFGLWRIQERVELLGGRLKIKSAAGQGTTFHLIVPCRDPVATSAQGGGGIITGLGSDRGQGTLGRSAARRAGRQPTGWWDEL